VIDLAVPHAGRWLAFTWVSCFQAPTGPAQISGGCCQSERIAATCLPSGDIARLPNGPAASPSSPCHLGSSLPVARSSVPIAVAPPTYSAMTICEADSHAMVFGEAARPGVRSTAGPPAAGTVKTSPPVEPSSLMSPLMKPIAAPSGDHLGIAICSAGLWITVAVWLSIPSV